jgi:hypothetical protein
MQGDMVGSAPLDLDIPNIQFSPLVVLWKGLPAMFIASFWCETRTAVH